ncbi:MAG: response regulator [Deltaproteobacteria bacterium]|nr:response regulator [Deltaproteobacteria bacterium]
MPAWRVLVIDDDPQIRETLGRFLRSHGSEVLVACNWPQGLEMVMAKRFDVVLTDLEMPGPDGIEVVKRVRDISPETAILMITGYPSAESTAKALAEGCDGYISKPFYFDKLKYLITQSVVLRRSHREEPSKRTRKHESTTGPFARLIRVFRR